MSVCLALHGFMCMACLVLSLKCPSDIKHLVPRVMPSRHGGTVKRQNSVGHWTCALAGVVSVDHWGRALRWGTVGHWWSAGAVEPQAFAFSFFTFFLPPRIMMEWLPQ